MLEFDPNDPFPLIAALAPEHYSAAKKHAAAADAWLGLDVPGTEARVHDPKDGEERWLDRHPSVFLTPYVELRAWLEELKPKHGETVADLGAGYGRLGFILARHFPGTKFLGLELVPERVKEGARALAKYPAPNARLETANLLHTSTPEAEIYFIYDFGVSDSILKVLDDLKRIAKTKEIRVVGRGRRVRDLIERTHPWLGSVHQPVHGPHYSVYRNFDRTL
jgi:SAM-dependent methyltransferase